MTAHEHTAENDVPGRTYAVNDSIGWDDRKTLSGLWQDHAPLPETGLCVATYEALLAVARWGAERMYDNWVTPPGEHFGYLSECPDGMDCRRPGCILAHVPAACVTPPGKDQL